MAKRAVKHSRKQSADLGEQTGLQTKDGATAVAVDKAAEAFARGMGLSGYSAVQSSDHGFPAPGPGTYDKYREISRHPTIALIENGVVYPPVQSNQWNYFKRGEGRRYKRTNKEYGRQMASAVPDDWVHFVHDVVDPLRSEVVRNSLLANRFGWAPQEQVWEKKKGWLQPTRFKPLLWDISTLLFDENGSVAGVENKPPDEKEATQLTGPNAFVFRWNAIAGQPYGIGRNEDVRIEYDQSACVRRRLAQYMMKQATIIPIVSHPDGTSLVNGAPYPNEYIAKSILEHAVRGDGIALKNKFASFPDLKTALEMAKFSDWAIWYVNPGPGDHTPGILTVLKYYDALFCRGWLVPERAALEAEHGKPADSKEHRSIATINAELLDVAIADAVNEQTINPLLEQRFGPEARGAVYADPNPIEDNTIQGILDLLKVLAANPIIGPWLTSVLNITGLLDRGDFPINDKMRDAQFMFSQPEPAIDLGQSPPAAGRMAETDKALPKPASEIAARLKGRAKAAMAARAKGNGQH